MTCQQRAEYLAQTYSDAILRLSYTYLKNTSDAQDICQSVFVKLLTQPQELNPRNMSGPISCGWRPTPARIF